MEAFQGTSLHMCVRENLAQTAWPESFTSLSQEAVCPLSFFPSPPETSDRLLSPGVTLFNDMWHNRAIVLKQVDRQCFAPTAVDGDDLSSKSPRRDM